MLRHWRALPILAALIATYVGSYVYVVNAHKSEMGYMVDFGNSQYTGSYLKRRFYYSMNSQVDSTCKWFFAPAYEIATRSGLQSAEYISADEHRQEMAVFSYFVQ